MCIFKNNIDKLPKCLHIDNRVYELNILCNEGYKVIYLNRVTNRIGKVVDKNGDEDLLMEVDYNFNKAINKMIKKVNEYNIK